jgi:AraC-like DNA-binding protein
VANPPTVAAGQDVGVAVGSADLLPRQPTFRTRDLEQARQYVGGVFVEHGITYLPHERSVDFRHRQAKLGAVTLNVLEYGAGVKVAAPPLGFYLLQFTLAGSCEIRQGRQRTVFPTGSVAVVNPFCPYVKSWRPGTRQLLLRLERSLVEREFRASTGFDHGERVEFDLMPVSDPARIGTLTRYVRMLCDDLRSESSSLTHPVVHDRVAATLASLLLAAIPHNGQRALAVASSPAAPFFVRRVEEYIHEHACEAVGLADLTAVARVSTRSLQMAFRRFRSTTPVRYLRDIRLDLARVELVSAGRRGGSVAEVAALLGFGHLGRFARDYRSRFGELPSETLARATVAPHC